MSDSGRYIGQADDERRAVIEEAAMELLAACKAFLAAKPQCKCTDDSGCSLAAARKLARIAVAKAEGM